MISISPDAVAAGYRKLGRAAVTRGAPREVSSSADRTGPHGDYSLPVFSGPDFQVWVERLKFFGIPLIIHVSRIRVQPAVEFKCFNILGLFQVHVVVRTLDGKQSLEPHYISHPLLKFLHPLLDKSGFLLS